MSCWILIKPRQLLVRHNVEQCQDCPTDIELPQVRDAVPSWLSCFNILTVQH